MKSKVVVMRRCKACRYPMYINLNISPLKEYCTIRCIVAEEQSRSIAKNRANYAK